MKINFNPRQVAMTSVLIQNVWGLLPRKPLSDFKVFGEAAISAVETYPPSDYGIGYRTGRIHAKATDAGVAFCKDCFNSPHEARVNYTAIALAGEVGSNWLKLEGKTNFPDRPPGTNDKKWMSTKTIWYDDPIYYQRRDMERSLENTVRYSIETAWRDRHTRDLPSAQCALRWENTAICALTAVYEKVASHELLRSLLPRNMKAVCQRTHELMIENNLWGKDNKNPDRTNPDGSPKPFDELSAEMKENYVLIVLATLKGISNYMISRKTVEELSGYLSRMDDGDGRRVKVNLRQKLSAWWNRFLLEPRY